jgi:hypothetical protein
MGVQVGRWFSATLVLLACLAAILGCSLKVADDQPTPAGDGGAVGDLGGEDSGGTLPTVQILSPVSGQQVQVGQDVEIRVVATDERGVTRLQLNVSGRTSSTKSFPEPASTAEALLRWRPDREGTFELSVIAFRGTVFSSPVAITLQVVGRSDTVSNPASGQAGQQVTAGAGECVARVLIGNLRIRGGPGTDFANLGNFELNEQVSVVGQNSDGSWIQIRRLDGSVNWVSNNPEWIETTGACTNLPVTG